MGTNDCKVKAGMVDRGNTVRAVAFSWRFSKEGRVGYVCFAKSRRERLVAFSRRGVGHQEKTKGSLESRYCSKILWCTRLLAEPNCSPSLLALSSRHGVGHGKCALLALVEFKYWPEYFCSQYTKPIHLPCQVLFVEYFINSLEQTSYSLDDSEYRVLHFQTPCSSNIPCGPRPRVINHGFPSLKQRIFCFSCHAGIIFYKMERLGGSGRPRAVPEAYPRSVSTKSPFRWMFRMFSLVKFPVPEKNVHSAARSMRLGNRL